jgi:hypothetical protein
VPGEHAEFPVAIPLSDPLYSPSNAPVSGGVVDEQAATKSAAASTVHFIMAESPFGEQSWLSWLVKRHVQRSMIA